MLIKQKSQLLPRNVTLRTFGELLILFSTKLNRLYLFFSTAQRFCFLHLVKQNCAENFSKNSNLIFTCFPFQNQFETVTHFCNSKDVLINLDLSKASGLDCIPVVVLKNSEPELSFILAESFSKCLKEYFPDCWKVSSVVPVFKNVGRKVYG